MLGGDQWAAGLRPARTIGSVRPGLSATSQFAAATRQRFQFPRAPAHPSHEVPSSDRRALHGQQPRCRRDLRRRLSQRARDRRSDPQRLSACWHRAAQRPHKAPDNRSLKRNRSGVQSRPTSNQRDRRRAPSAVWQRTMLCSSDAPSRIPSTAEMRTKSGLSCGNAWRTASNHF